MTAKKKNKNKKKSKQSPVETVMINSVHTEYDHLLVSSYLNKRDDPGVPTIECKINQRIFHKTFYDTRSSVNIMSKVTYEYLFSKEPLYLTYV
jgi:myo-inositol-1-phosphate synthase